MARLIDGAARAISHQGDAISPARLFRGIFDAEPAEKL
jgi:hypothetical protein